MQLSKFSSPLICIRKKDGRLRIVHSFQNLNRKKVDEKYETHDPNELLNRVAGSLLITKIDITRAYFQIPIAPESEHLTAFNSPFGKYCYKVTAMGLRCAASSCQRLVDMILRNMHRYAGSLQDDIIIFSKDFDSHMGHVKSVLQRLREAGVTANPKKCSIACDDLILLGHRVKQGQIFPSDEKIQIVKNWPMPQTKRQ